METQVHFFLLQKTSGGGQGEKDGLSMEVCQDDDDGAKYRPRGKFSVIIIFLKLPCVYVCYRFIVTKNLPKSM